LGYESSEDEFWGYDDLLISSLEMDWDRPCAIYPDLRNARIHAQQGSFTIHGDNHQALDKQLPRSRQKILRKVQLPPESFDGAYAFLQQAGLSHGLLFPDLQGLSISLKRKHQLK